jgi:hypothetical protein
LNFKNLVISEIAATFIFIIVYGARILVTVEVSGTLPIIGTAAIVFGVIVASFLYGIIDGDDKAKAIIMLTPLVIAAIGPALVLNNISTNVAIGFIAVSCIGMTLPLMKHCPNSFNIFSSLTTLGVLTFVFARCSHIFFGV